MMRPQRALAILLLLALLLSSVSTTGRWTTWAAELQVDASPITHVAEPPNPLADADTTEGLPFDLPVGRSVEQQDELFSVFSDPEVPPSPSADDEWQIESADVTNQLSRMTGMSLRPDGDRQPLIAYGEDYLDAARDDWTGWQIERVDADNLHDSSLALDGSDRPHISYLGHAVDGSDVLKYAWHDGTSWQIETVDRGRHIAGHTSLALDGTGRPHISYLDYDYDIGRWILKHAWHDRTDWQIERVHIVGTLPGNTSLALDAAGRPHIIYKVYTDLWYTWYDGATWLVERVDYGSPSPTSLALDAAGRPHISYLGHAVDGSDVLKYAWYDGTGWQIETVDAGFAPHTSLALDGADRPHISYTVNDVLKYAWHDGTDWQIETVIIEGNPGWGLLALDGADRPHFAYIEPDGDYYDPTLKYAWHNGTSWQIETVDCCAMDAIGGHSLAVDSLGRPHISYVYEYWPFKVTYHFSLRHAWRTAPVPSLDKRAEPTDGLRNNDTLSYTLHLYGPGFSARLWDPLPENVHYISGSITGTVAPAAVYSPTVNAVIWQGTLAPDLSQQISFQVTPGITGTGSLSLALPIVNTAWLTDTVYGMSDSSTVIVNGWHAYFPLMLHRFP